MSDSKIEIKIGIIEFSGEGEPKWLSEQLDKILEKTPELLNLEIPNNSNSNLKEKSPSSKSAIFLATSIWIHDNLEKSRIQQKDINIELKKSSQTPIPNLAQELRRNVKKGYIVKDGSNFYVTPEGRK